MTSWLAKHKALLFVGLLCVLFGVATIVLAVELSKALEDNSDTGGGDGGDNETTTEFPGTEPWETSLRIPQDVVPVSYDVILSPDFATNTFTGAVKVSVTTTAARNHIAIHVKQLDIMSNVVQDSRGQNVSISEAFLYPRNEFYVMKFANDLPAGTYCISMEFGGNLTMGGFYLSTYKNGNNIK